MRLSTLKRSLENMEELIFSLKPSIYVIYLRKKGISIGPGTQFFGRVYIDKTRPSLVRIGSNCALVGVTVLTHGYDWIVLRQKYGEVLACSGMVTISDNVFIGLNSIILKGVHIGCNTIIGAGSVVTHDIPADSVAAGIPCEVIMSIEQYYRRRKQRYAAEAEAYALHIYQSTHRAPRPSDFWEEFPLFLERRGDWSNLQVSVKEMFGEAYHNFLESKPVYPSFKAFLKASGIPDEALPSEDNPR